MKTMIRIASVLTLFSTLVVPPAHAGPQVVMIAGKAAKGQTMMIWGAEFGDKIPAKPYLWADFEAGLEPSPLGQVTAWSQNENMERASDGFNGTWGARGMAVNPAGRNSVSWTLRTDYDAWTKNNQKFYVYRRQKMNFSITDQSQNWKIWRMWPNGPGGYPNVYAASSNGRVYVEGPNNGFWTNPNGGLRMPANTWYVEEVIGKASSDIDKADGRLAFRIDGVDKCGGTSMMFRSTAYPGVMKSQYAMHGVAANINQWTPAWNANNRMWADDIYVDTTWARVMLGDQPTFATCRKLEIQIPTSWAECCIGVIVNPGAFANGSRAYVYVFDKDGNVNSAGYPITVGQNYGTFVASGGTPPDAVVPARPSNVFNPGKNESVEIFHLDRAAAVDYAVFDRLGRRVRSYSGERGAGKVGWDGRNDDGGVVASGLYIVQKKLDGGPRSSQKVVVLK